MATSNVSKTAVYESLYLISLGTQQIVDNLEWLKAAHILAPKPAELRKLAANQLRAEIAAAATLNLMSREMNDAYQQEKERLRLKKHLAKSQPKKQSKKIIYCHGRSGHSARSPFRGWISTLKAGAKL